MIVEASITGLFKTIFIIVGVLVLLRFLGQLFVAKKNMEDERRHLERERKFQKEKEKKMKNFGKTKVLDNQNGDSAEDVDFETVGD